MKKIYSLILGMVLTLGINAYAAEYTPSLIYNNEVKQIENIKNVNGRVILPFRAIFEMMGATVDYEQETSKVTALRDDKKVEFYVNGDRIFVTEDGKTNEIPAEIGFDYERNRVMVPVRFISNALGARVGWNSEQRCVYVLDTYPMVKSLVTDCPDFFEYAEKSSALEKNIKSDTSMNISFSGLFDNKKVKVNLDTDVTGSSYENLGTGSLKLNFTHDNLDDAIDYNLGEVKGLTFDVLKTEDAIYLNTNLPSKLSSLFPEEENLKNLDSMINDDVWVRIDYDYLEEQFDKATADAVFYGLEASTENTVDILLDNLSMISYSDADVTEEEMYSVKEYFDIYKSILKKAVFKDKGNNSFEFKFQLDTDDLINIIYPENIASDIKISKKEIKSILNINLNSNISVRNGVIENETANFDMKFNDPENPLNITIGMDIAGKSKKLTSAPKLNIPEDSVALDTILMLLQ